MTIVGSTYIERGEPVTVLAMARRRRKTDPTFDVTFVGKVSSSGPMNALMRRKNGDLVVRPFRGLRKPDA